MTDAKREMDPSTLPDDIYRLFEEGHEVSEESVEWAGQVFMDLLRSRFVKREEVRGDKVLRFSSLGKPDRQLWYAANMPEEAEVFTGKTLLKFMYGDLIEVLLLFLAKESGHEVTHLQTEVEVDGVHGHTDCSIDGIPVDVKSASPYSFGKFESGEFVFQDSFGYVNQLSGYAHALDRTDRAGFFVANKVDGGLCFAELDELTIKANAPGPRIAQAREAIARETPPPRCYPTVPDGKSGNEKLGIGCSYCAFKDVCYADANNGQGLRKFWFSRGPVWLSTVKREPRVDEVT